MNKREKILGCLVGAAAGDAMGAPTELRTRKQIIECFGGEVTDFVDPPQDTIGKNNKAGMITDDFSLAYVTLQTLLERGGTVDEAAAREALIRWSDHHEWFDDFVGPTTKAAIDRMRAGDTAARKSALVNENSKSSDGGAMKIAPVSLLAGGDVDKAIENAVIICAPTHPNNIAMSGAGAVAAATAAAMQDDADLFRVVKAGIYGARKAEELGRAYHENAGPSVEKRIKLAVSIGLTADSLDEAMDEIADVIGTGLPANEAVPAAFGLLVASGGNTVDAIRAGVNIGWDTDTVATMCGGILGALNGIGSMPPEWLPFLQERNAIDLEQLADSIFQAIE
ncbi:MAG: ADP-ribosylglycohydrolase family protein [Mogibacterium sp.]|nr:ADP-ribosylglycohydrolase family protein [Mogibacterium sp.]